MGLSYVQFTADMLNPDLPSSVINSQIKRINAACEKYNVSVTSTFTGGFTRVNHLAHPDLEVREHWVKWFKRFVDITLDLGASAMGSHFGIFTHYDNSDSILRFERRTQNIECWHEIGKYAIDKGLEYLSWEPMSISREQGETISEALKLQKDVNNNAPIPFKVCLDVDHGDLSSTNPDDTNPHAWLKAFSKESQQIHLKQSSMNKSSHWPFTKECNEKGCIRPDEIIQTMHKSGYKDTDMILELSFREREPEDSTVVEVLKESVDYWRDVVTK